MANETQTQPAPKYELKLVASIESDRQLHRGRISPCGKVFVGGGYDGKAHRWAIADDGLKPLPAIDGHHGWVSALAFSAVGVKEGSLLITGDTWGQVQCQKYEGDKPQVVWQVKEGHDGWVRDMVFDAARKSVISCGRDKAIRSFAVADGAPTKVFQHDDDVLALALSPDGKSLAFGDWRGNVRLVDMASRKVVKEIDASVLYKYDRIQDVDGLRVLRFIDAGKTLLVAGSAPARGATMQGIPTMLFFDVESGKLKATIEHGQTKDGHIEDIAIHPDGFLVAGSSGVPGNGRLFAARMQDDKPFLDHTKVANIHAVSLHPDGRRLIATGTNKGSNGNGRRVDKDGNYIGNTSPVVMFELAKASDKPEQVDKTKKK